MYDYEKEKIKSDLLLYFSLLIFICGLILFSAWYSGNVDKAVKNYEDSCECRSVMMGDTEVKDCICKTYPDKFKEEMEKTK